MALDGHFRRRTDCAGFGGGPRKARPTPSELSLLDDDVVSGTAVKGVVAASALEPIVASAALQHVVTAGTDQDVVASTATRAVLTNRARGQQAGIDDVVGTTDRVEIGQDEHGLCAGDDPGRPQPGDGGAGGRRAADPDLVRAIGALDTLHAIDGTLVLRGVDGWAEVDPHDTDVRSGEAVEKGHTLGPPAMLAFTNSKPLKSMTSLGSFGAGSWTRMILERVPSLKNWKASVSKGSVGARSAPLNSNVSVPASPSTWSLPSPGFQVN